MSLKKHLAKPNTPLIDAAKLAVSDIAQQGAGLTSDTVVKNLVSMESLDSVNATNLYAAIESAESLIESAFGDALALENFESNLAFREDKETATAEANRLRKVALESGAVAALASANPAAYARKALSLESVAPQGGTLVELPSDGEAGSLGYTVNVANEAYDESELKKYMPATIAFNTFAARQDAFGEAFFPTVVISADQGGADLTVRRQRVHHEVRHAITGKVTDFGFRNLLSAAIEADILKDQSTRLVPYRDPSIASPEFLLNTNQFGPKSVVIDGVDVPTAPYKFGKNIGLIGLSNYAPLVGAGVLDHTDSVAPRVSLQSIYMYGGVDSGTSDDLPVIGFNVSGMHRSSFVGSTEGRDREMTLMFKFEDLVIDPNTTAVNGSSPAILDPIVNNNLTAYCSVMISGTLDTQFGNVQLNSSTITVTRIVDNSGVDVSMSSGTGLAARQAIEGAAMVGYDLLAYRTNSNRRTAGLRLDVESITERYSVLVSPPISVQRPATATDGEAAELEALVNAVRLRNSNNAVTSLLNQAATLRATVRGPGAGRMPQITGLGRLLVEPFYEELELDMSSSLSSTKSSERAADVSATIVQGVRDLLYRMYQFSGIQAALDAQNQTGNESPVPLIGTDQTIARHLMVQGDTRTFGTMFPEARVVVSQDHRVRNRIFVSFSRAAGLDGMDPLRFGTHLWIPELVSRMPVSRNGATNLEAMVQTRNLHVCHLPVLGVIKVTNLPAAMVDKTTMYYDDSPAANPWLGDVVFDPNSDVTDIDFAP